MEEENPKEKTKKSYTRQQQHYHNTYPTTMYKFRPIKKCTTRAVVIGGPSQVRKKLGENPGITKFRWNCLVSEKKLPSVRVSQTKRQTARVQTTNGKKVKTCCTEFASKEDFCYRAINKYYINCYIKIHKTDNDGFFIILRHNVHS